MNYDVYLMDADETLFDFVKAEQAALANAFGRHGLKCPDGAIRAYREINADLWVQFESGQIEKDVLLVKRFAQLFERLGIGVDAHDFNAQYLVELGKGVDLIDGALEICRLLHEKGKHIYIVTNGASVSQRMRLEGSRIRTYISDIFISEDVGFQKPRKEYFDYVFQQLPPTDRSKIIMIGNSLTSDVQGGLNAGVDTCWFNKDGERNMTNLIPTYQISRLEEIALL